MLPLLCSHYKRPLCLFVCIHVWCVCVYKQTKSIQQTFSIKINIDHRSATIWAYGSRPEESKTNDSDKSRREKKNNLKLEQNTEFTHNATLNGSTVPQLLVILSDDGESNRCMGDQRRHRTTLTHTHPFI